MKIHNVFMVVSLVLSGALITASPSSAAPRMVPMTFKLSNQDGKPLRHIWFSETSSSGSTAAGGWFVTNKHGVGHYQAIADSTVSVFLAVGHHGHSSFFREVWGQIHSIDDSEPVEQLGTYVISVDSGDSGATSAFTLPDLITHRVRVVTATGEPVAGASITVDNVSVPETDNHDSSYRVSTEGYGFTNLNGWAKFTTFQDDPQAAAKLAASVNAPSVDYNPTHGSSATLIVSETRYVTKDTLRVVVAHVPHFAHVTSHPGQRPGIAVVSATLRDVSGVLAHRRVSVYRQAGPNSAITTATELAHGRTNAHGRITFHVKLRHPERVLFYWPIKTFSPGVVVAKPR